MSTNHIIFLYGTETGVAEEYAFMVAYVAANNGMKVTVLPVDDYPLSKWGTGETPSPIVFFISTAGQGEMPMTMRNTWEILRMSDAPDVPEKCRYAIFGLGDSTYTKFNYAAKMFHNRLQQLGATPLIHRGLGDERDGKGLAQELSPWLEKLWAALGIHLTKPSIIVPQNRFELTKSDNFIRTDSTDNALQMTNQSEEPSSTPQASTFLRPGCWQMTVANNVRLTASTHYQHVSYITFERDLSDPEKGRYAPGDCLSLYPQNTQEAVNRALKALRIIDDGQQKYIIKPNTNWGLEVQPSRPFFGIPITLAELFTRFIDLDATASQTFLRMFSVCAAVSGDEELRERMADLGSPSNCEDYNSFAYREKRTVIEVMEDFPKIAVPLEAFISNAPLLRPRYYSISSSPTMDKDVIGLTVALFHLVTPLGRDRKGLCSRWLCEATKGSTIEGCFLHRPFEIHPKAPLILIGPGTGVAPLRGIIRERAALAAASGTASPEMILFFGCRNQQGDFLHGDEWPAIGPALKVVTAFSRDDTTGKKVYVQHKLIDDSEAATRVFKLLTNTDEELYGGGGVVIICGNAKHMPKSVQDALASIISAGKGLSKEDALVFVNRLRSEGRMKFETWSV